MTRTGREMVWHVRELLHDTGRNSSTSNTFYETAEILRRLNEAKFRVSKALMKIGAPQPALQTLPAIATTSRLWKTANATQFQAAPSDFLALYAGIKADNTSVACEPPNVGEAMQAGGHDTVYVVGGAFRGTATLALYAAAATEPIAETSTILTEFPDGVYDAIEMLAARELLVQEQADNADRWKLFGDFFGRAIQSFK